MLNDNRQTPLLGGNCELLIDVLQHYEIVKHSDPQKGPWKVSITGYMYHLRDKAGRMAGGYHWHPISNSHVLHPHLHLAGKQHYPTGRVLVEEVLNLATELGAEPRDADKWAVISNKNREAFGRGATWGAYPAWTPTSG